MTRLKRALQRLSDTLAPQGDRRDYAALLREANARALRGDPAPGLPPDHPYAHRLAEAQTRAEALRQHVHDR